jgi:hypothetical protein
MDTTFGKFQVTEGSTPRDSSKGSKEGSDKGLPTAEILGFGHVNGSVP